MEWDTYSTLHLGMWWKKDCQDTWDKRSDLVHWEDIEESGGEGGGRGDGDGEHM